jgi:hypothetical protein
VASVTEEVVEAPVTCGTLPEEPKPLTLLTDTPLADAEPCRALPLTSDHTFAAASKLSAV